MQRHPVLQIALLLAVFSVCGSGPAKAGLVLGFGQNDYVVNAGQGIDVQVFLTESDTSILTTEGLNSVGLVVSFNLPPSVTDPAQVTLITPNPGVNATDDFLSTTINPATASTSGTAELLFSDVLKPSSGSSSILLGTFHFVAGSISGQVTNLSVGIAPGGSQFFSGTGQDLDAMISNGQATISTTAAPSVPEPSSLAIASIGLAAGIGARLRRRRSA